MKKSKLFFSALMLLLASLIFLVNNSVGEEEVPFLGKITADKVLIRSGYNENFNSILSLSKGDLVVVRAKHFSWYKVVLPATAVCYVHSDYIEKTSSNAGTVKGHRLNVRSGPDTNFPILGQLERDEKVAIKEKKGDWYTIFPTESTYGWIHEDYLEHAGRPEAFLEKKRILDAFEEKFSAIEAAYKALLSGKDELVDSEPLLKEISALEIEYKEHKELVSRIQAKKDEIIKTMNELRLLEEVALANKPNVMEVEGKIKELGRFWRKRGTHKLLTDAGEVFYLESEEIDLNTLLRHPVKIWGVVEEDNYYRKRPLLKVKEVVYCD